MHFLPFWLEYICSRFGSSFLGSGVGSFVVLACAVFPAAVWVEELDMSTANGLDLKVQPCRSSKRHLEEATFALGWFWGPQEKYDNAGFESVAETRVGYTGGTSEMPTYESVCRGDGHTEALKIRFDPSKTKYKELLDLFWKQNRGSSGRNPYKTSIWYCSFTYNSYANTFCL